MGEALVTVTQNDVAISGLHCSFGATTTIPRPYRWHWMRNGILIPGAPSACAYTTPPVQSNDLGARYSVRVFGLDGEIEASDEVELRGPKSAVEVPVLKDKRDKKEN